MISKERFMEIVFSMNDVEERPHFEIPSYTINKKIFATLNYKELRACIKLNEIDQDAFCAYRKDVMYPVPNKWGKHGWTNINLLNIPDEMLEDALKTAYETVKLGKKKKQSE